MAAPITGKINLTKHQRAIVELDKEITRLMALKAGHMLVLKEAERRRQARKHKYHDLEKTLHELLRANGWDEEEESDSDFMMGEKEDYAEIVIDLLKEDGYTDKQIATMALEYELREGQGMFYDFIRKHGTKKEKEELAMYAGF